MEAFIIIAFLIIGIVVMIKEWLPTNEKVTTRELQSTERSGESAARKKTVVPPITPPTTIASKSPNQPRLTEQEFKASELLLLNGLRLKVPQVSDTTSSWISDIKGHPLAWYSEPLGGGSLANLKTQIDNWKQLGVRFASIPSGDSETRTIHLVFKGLIRERVGPAQREVALSNLISQGFSCLVQRIATAGESDQSMEVTIELNTTQSLRTSCRQAATQPRIWNLDFAMLTGDTNSNWADLWTGIDDQGQYIIRNPRFSERKPSEGEGNNRLIVELTTETAVVRNISAEDWRSDRYRSYKQCEHASAVREDCLALYRLHYQAIWKQVKVKFIRNNAELIREVGLPIVLDKSFPTIVDENVSDYMREQYRAHPFALSSLEHSKIEGYGRLVDECHTANHEPPSFSRYCEDIHHILSCTEGRVEEEAWYSEQSEAMRREYYDNYDYNELGSEDPLNRF